MAQLQDVQDILAAAERAAAGGDLASSDELLRSAARIQEQELGPLHPDLANTLNNLAVVAEQAGRLDDAESFYRRAVAIASASLPADDPMVTASRQNLEAFCRARGLPIEAPAIIAAPAIIDAPAIMAAPAWNTKPESLVTARKDAADDVQAAVHGRSVDAGVTVRVTPSPSDKPVAASRPPRPSAADPLPLPSREASRSFTGVAVAAVVLLTAGLLVTRPWSSRETPAPAPAAAAAPAPVLAPAAAPAVPKADVPDSTPPAAAAPIQETQPPKVVPPAADPPVVTGKTPAPRRSTGAIALASAQLCQTFSTSGGRWRCGPAGESVAPGPLILYTRVTSPGGGVVVHRWYRGDALRQSVDLTVRASATEGYRTYSRQTVNGGDWRVEVRSAAGELLHEQRFAVR